MKRREMHRKNTQARELTKEEYWEIKKGYLSKFGITENDIEKNLKKRQNKISHIKNAKERSMNLLDRTIVLRLILESMPGKTIEEKRKKFEEIRNSDLMDFLGKMPGVGKRSGSSASKTKFEKMTAGIEKVTIGIREEMKELYEKNFDLDEFRRNPERAELRRAAKDALRLLKTAGIIKMVRSPNGRVERVKVLKPEALQKTIETGYIQFPNLKPIYEREEKETR